MAFLLKRKGSPHWHLRFFDPQTRGWRQRNTKLSICNRNETRQAKNLCDWYAAKESRRKAGTLSEAWKKWVPEYIDARWGGSGSNNTRKRYQAIWRNWCEYLETKELLWPRQLRREDVLEYLQWRQMNATGLIRKCKRNTAILEVKVFGMWVDEAIRRGYSEQNPCRNLGWSKDQPPEKPEISDDDIALITEELARKPEWMNVSFRISIYHGVRLRATQVDLLTDVDWNRMTVTFREKGGYVYAVPLHPLLVPLFYQLKARGLAKSCVLPKNASKKWGQFFRGINRPQYCFHCCRVTVITRLARERVPENLAMKYVGHRSAEMHRIYQKLHADDLHLCHSAIHPRAVNL